MKTPCRYPGCRALLDKSGYCQAHASSAPRRHTDYNKQVRAKDAALAEAHRIRKGKRWLSLRKIVLSANPLCSDPFGVHARRASTETATQVHHIKGLAEHPELAYDFDNLCALCSTCHARIEREVRSSTGDAPTPCKPSSPPRWGIC